MAAPDTHTHSWTRQRSAGRRPDGRWTRTAPTAGTERRPCPSLPCRRGDRHAKGQGFRHRADCACPRSNERPVTRECGGSLAAHTHGTSGSRHRPDRDSTWGPRWNHLITLSRGHAPIGGCPAVPGRHSGRRSWPARQRPSRNSTADPSLPRGRSPRSGTPVRATRHWCMVLFFMPWCSSGCVDAAGASDWSLGGPPRLAPVPLDGAGERRHRHPLLGRDLERSARDGGQGHRHPSPRPSPRERAGQLGRGEGQPL